MRDVKIEGYLTQSKLEAALASLLGDSWLGSEIKVLSSGHRWDTAFKRGARVVVVEYDGDEHYRSSLRIKNDRRKDVIARDLGYQVVRVPYWVQLESLTLKHFFELEARVVQDFPHGFITTKLFPASFCELGCQRFASELDSLPTAVRDAVVRSLEERAKEHGLEYVLPTSLRHLLAT